MPLYEYRCRACGDTSEELRPVGRADAPVECACGVADTTRLPSLVARPGTGTPAGAPDAGAVTAGCCGGGGCACGR